MLGRYPATSSLRPWDQLRQILAVEAGIALGDVRVVI